MALTLSAQECRLIDQVLARFLNLQGNDDIRAQVQALQVKFRSEMVTDAEMSWDPEKIKIESPEL
jgi:hypothetical protein